VTAGPDAGMLMPRYEWRFNDSSGGEDACKNGVCPSVVTIDDPGGYFAVAGFDIVSNTPTMRVMTPQKTNPNCIENAVPGGKLSGRGLSEAVSAASGKPVLTGKPAHNGEHVLIPPGTTAPVHTLPLMAGTILHGSRQNSNPREHAYNFAIIDILLNVTIEGEKYVMTLADQFYKGAKVTGRITTNTPLGTIEGTDNPLNESGLHITLLPYSIWKTYIADPGFPRGARDSVPYSSLMSVGHDPRSPFRCP
jgi:hypothetical protein